MTKRYQEKASTYLTKSLRGSNKLDRAATREIVVLSPPGMMSASQLSSCCCVRTSINSHCEAEGPCDSAKTAAAFFSSCICS